MKKVVLILLGLFWGSALVAQTASAVQEGEASLSVYERMRAKNRARVFSDVPSPRGEQYIYLDDQDLRMLESINPEVTVDGKTRTIVTVVHSYTPSRVVAGGDEVSIGTLRILKSEDMPRKFQLKTFVELGQPLVIEVRERSPADLE